MIRRAIEQTQENAEHQQLKEQIRGQYSFANIVGQSKKMKDLFELIESVAASDANILIQGENGTGKELIANAIHYNSNRVEGPVHQDQLRGDPQGPDRERAVRLQEGRVHRRQHRQGRPVRDGGGRLAAARRDWRDAAVSADQAAARAAGARVPADRQRSARPRGLPADLCHQHRSRRGAARGKLREDLYFRINTITLRVPPLRERSEDIPLLCNHFLSKFNQRYQKNVRAISPAAYHLLIRNRWPATCASWRTPSSGRCWSARPARSRRNDLPETIREEGAPAQEFTIPPHRTLAEIEKMAILQTLQRTNWNKQEAAQILGLYRPTLYSKMKKHEIQDQRAQQRAAAAAASNR